MAKLKGLARVFVAAGLCLDLCLIFAHARSESGTEMTGAFTPARAMASLYGSYSRARESSEWKPTRAKSFPRNWPNQVKVYELLDASYVEQGRQAHLLVTWAIPQPTYEGEYTCHSCGALIGLARFSRYSGVWRADVKDLQYGEYGTWGQPPTIFLQPLGPEHFGAMMVTSFGTQGVNEESDTILVPENGRFEPAFSREIAKTWDEDGCSGNPTPERADSCVAYDGAIDWAAKANSGFYDLLLTRRVYHSLSRKSPVGTTVTRFPVQRRSICAPSDN